MRIWIAHWQRPRCADACPRINKAMPTQRVMSTL